MNATTTVTSNGKTPKTAVHINVRCELVEANIVTNRALMRAIDRPDAGEIEVRFSDFVGESDNARLTDEFSRIILAACPMMTTNAAMVMVAKLVARVAE
jgi:hypothetical protein